jgi:hypothetical protein
MVCLSHCLGNHPKPLSAPGLDSLHWHLNFVELPGYYRHLETLTMNVLSSPRPTLSTKRPSLDNFVRVPPHKSPSYQVRLPPRAIHSLATPLYYFQSALKDKNSGCFVPTTLHQTQKNAVPLKYYVCISGFALSLLHTWSSHHFP